MEQINYDLSYEEWVRFEYLIKKEKWSDEELKELSELENKVNTYFEKGLFKLSDYNALVSCSPRTKDIWAKMKAYERWPTGKQNLETQRKQKHIAEEKEFRKKLNNINAEIVKEGRNYEDVLTSLKELQKRERQAKNLVAGINSLLKDITDANVGIGTIHGYEGRWYEVIDIRPAEIYEYNEEEDIRYSKLCLALVNYQIDKSDLAKRIRKDKFWASWRYGHKKQKAIKDYYEKNVITLTQPFYVRHTKTIDDL